MRPTSGGRVLGLVCLALSATLGCLFDPRLDVKSCELTCDEECPAGLECTAEGYCVAPGWTQECASPLLAVVDTEVSALSCKPLALELEHLGGSGAVSWTARTELPAGLTLIQSSDGASAQLTAGSHALDERPYLARLQVEDAHGQTDSVDVLVDVVDCLSVDTPVVVSACVGEPLVVELDQLVEGGYGHRHWSLVSSDEPEAQLDANELRVSFTESDTYTIAVELEDFEAPDDRLGDAGAPALSELLTLEIEAKDCLRVEPLVLAQPICIGSPTEIDVSVRGGVGERSIAVNGLPAGFKYDRATGTIRGATDRIEGGEFEITVSDAADGEDSLRVAYSTAECPMITSLTHQACADRAFDFQLVGHGQGDLLWSMEGAPSWLELDAAKGKLKGKAPTAAQYEVLLSLKDATGLGVQASFVLVVESEQVPACGAPVDVQTRLLADACVGQPYEQALRATGGGRVADWTFAALEPGWLRLNEETNTLSGTPPADALDSVQSLQFRIESAPLLPEYLSLDLRVRRSCKYAFVDQDKALYLADVRAQPNASNPFPAVAFSDWLADGERVTRFEFSSDGRWLAFSTSLGDSVNAYMYALTGPLDERAPIAIGGLAGAVSVLDLDLARGPEAATRAGLAVALVDTDGETQVVVVTQSDGFQAPTTFSVPDWVGDLTFTPLGLCHFIETLWDGIKYETAWVCHKLDGAGRPLPAVIEVAAFSEGHYNSDRVLQIQGDAVFMFFNTDRDQPLHSYLLWETAFRGETGNVGLFHEQAIPDLGLNVAALQVLEDVVADVDTRKGIFLLDHTRGVALSAASAATDFSVGCAHVDSWHGLGRAVACRSTSAAEPLLISELDANGVVVDTQLVDNSEGFGDNNRSHVFSADGRYFLFGGPEGELMRVDLDADQWAATPIAEAGMDGTELSLRPLRGGQVLYQRADALKVLDLDAGGAHRLIPGGLAPPYACEADFSQGGPLRWCGSPSAARPYATSANGLGVVFPLPESGRLYAVDLASSFAPDAVAVQPNVLACGPLGCDSDILFAP